MQWYINDASLQGQFADRAEFEGVLRDLITARSRVEAIRRNLRLTRLLKEARVDSDASLMRAVFDFRDKDLIRATLSWLDRNGPFVEDDRLEEPQDYFEYCNFDVTETGLGEAARRTKWGFSCTAYSFVGGQTDYSIDPLAVDHGLLEDRLGKYLVANVWHVEALIEHALATEAPPRSWAALVATAQERFQNLEVGALDKNPALAREPFEPSISDRALELLKILDGYVADRDEDGAEGGKAREIIESYFTGDRALFSGESPTNRRKFAREMTFQRKSGESYVAHWHGKISHRFFRMHFEWPLQNGKTKLEIFYLGPKITKS